jgi:CO/xanthine dehydrogenase FAD-binding subunit
LVALDAEAEIADVQGRVWRSVSDLFLGPGKSAVDPRQQMLTAIRFPVADGRHGSAWERIGRRRALVLPILNCGISVVLDATGRNLRQARIGMGPVAPVPFRARATEAFLAGRAATDETFAEAAEIAAGEAQPRTSLLRASKEYRVEVLRVLVHRGLARAVTQAQEHAT